MKITDERAARLVLAQRCPRCRVSGGTRCIRRNKFGHWLYMYMQNFHVARVRLVGRRVDRAADACSLTRRDGRKP